MSLLSQQKKKDSRHSKTFNLLAWVYILLTRTRSLDLIRSACRFEMTKANKWKTAKMNFSKSLQCYVFVCIGERRRNLFTNRKVSHFDGFKAAQKKSSDFNHTCFCRGKIESIWELKWKKLDFLRVFVNGVMMFVMLRFLLKYFMENFLVKYAWLQIFKKSWV